jgi:hypothetical protein
MDRDDVGPSEVSAVGLGLRRSVARWLETDHTDRLRDLSKLNQHQAFVIRRHGRAGEERYQG